ncbi:hypothetical protein GCM10022198_12690 [Klugiella xanthotipulae]|uniref:Parallel beta-helix repeat protein n=1 Tax=Klugiella xanthotipulae TaxID=244735 RepID=A0A543I441_9MICO|nr:right-handed parallel beta-helix repeat-containing protein [Klugiella xanthotipulae]TQM65359.1 parallel beta-helix repeat protein [Klugiella xanthotipulae]
MTRAQVYWLAAAAVGVLTIAAILWSVASGPRGEPTTRASTAPADTTPTEEATPAPAAAAGDCPAATVTVGTARELTRALSAAEPGSVIRLRPGVYSGTFEASDAGTAANPVWLCGSADSVLDGGDITDGYVLHLDGADYWNLSGFTVRNGQKGVMLDATAHASLTGLTVTDIGNEGIHLRNNSVSNTVSGNTVSHTGKVKPKFGEGIYVGTAESNWCRITNCNPDRSDNNTVANNTISDTTAESVDIKEGTTGGSLSGNSFDGTAITAADSWVDVKGNDWTVTDNTGVNSPEDGFQTHEILDGWGNGNSFSTNTAHVNGPGFAIKTTPVLANVVHCNNVESGAARGLSNVGCVG